MMLVGMGMMDSFDGDKDEIYIADSAGIQVFDEVTVSLWFKTSETIANNVLLNKHADIYIRTGSTANSLVVGHSDLDSSWTSVSGLPSFNDGKWHHVAWTKSNGKSIIYFDGLNVVEKDVTGTIDSTGKDLRIGDGPWIGNKDWNGAIDDVKIWDYGLTDVEISEEYGVGVPEVEGGKLVAHYSFEGNANDVSGNGYDVML